MLVLGNLTLKTHIKDLNDDECFVFMCFSFFFRHTLVVNFLLDTLKRSLLNFYKRSLHNIKRRERMWQMKSSKSSWHQENLNTTTSLMYFILFIATVRKFVGAVFKKKREIRLSGGNSTVISMTCASWHIDITILFLLHSFTSKQAASW